MSGQEGTPFVVPVGPRRVDAAEQNGHAQRRAQALRLHGLQQYVTPGGPYSVLMFLALLAGFASGLRSLTPVAVVAWAAQLGVLDLSSSPLAFLGSRAAVTILTLLALGEIAFDKLPSAPKRTDLPGLVARVLLGGFAALAVAESAGSALAIGATLGAVGGIAGAFAGYEARTRLVRRFRVPDLVVALAEDAMAIAASVVVVTLS